MNNNILTKRVNYYCYCWVKRKQDNNNNNNNKTLGKSRQKQY